MSNVPVSSANINLPAESRGGGRGPRFSSFAGTAAGGIRLAVCRSILNCTEFDLPPGTYEVGSGADCDIVMDAPGVAARHCTLIVGHQRTLIKSWSQRTWINDGAVSEGTLKIGDRLILGPVELLVSALPAVAVGAGRTGVVSDDELLQLLTAARRREVSPPPPAAAASEHRESLLQELLNEVQSSLDQLLQRERNTREEFSRERLVLRHRAQELEQQRELLQRAQQSALSQNIAGRIHPELTTKIQQQQSELSRLEAILSDRHEELAGRARSLVGIHRRLKQWDQELHIRQTELSAVPDNRQMSALRAMLARNEAQGRQLNARENELEQREEAYHRQLLEIAENRSQLVDQTRQLEDEQKAWTLKSRNRERFLDEFESTISQRSQELEEESAHLAAVGNELLAREQTIDRNLQELETRTRELDHLTEELNSQQLHLAAQRETLQAERQALDRTAAELANDQQQLRMQQQNFQQQLAQLEDRERVLQSQEEASQVRESELSRQRGEILEQQCALEQREQSLARQFEDLQSQSRDLQTREARLAEERLELTRIESDTATAAGSPEESERKELAATQQNVEARQLELAERIVKLDAEKDELESLRDELQSSLSEAAAERMNLSRLRTELQAERQRDSYEREQLQNARRQLQSLESELETQQQRLAEQLADLERREQHLQFLDVAPATPGLEPDPQLRQLELERQALEEAREQLRQSSEKLAQEQLSLQQDQRELQLARQDYERSQAQLSEQHEEIAESRRQLAARERDHEESRLQLAADQEQLRRDQEALEHRRAEEAREPACEGGDTDGDANPPALSALSQYYRQTPAEAAAPEPAPVSESDDESALQLRQQLASLFGMSADDTAKAAAETPKKSKAESPRRDKPVPPARASANTSGMSAEPPRSPAPPPAATPPTPPPTTSGAAASDDELSVAAYMERLLARSRPGGQPPETAASVVAPTPKPKIEPQVDQRHDADEEEQQEIRRKRKLDEGTKKSIRENLHSFREVANQSARKAVAKSSCSRKSSSLRWMTMLNFAGWAAALALLTAELWLDVSLLNEAVSVGGVSLLLTLLCIYRLKEIRKLSQRSAPAAEKVPGEGNQADSKEDDGGNPKSGSLSFL